MRYKHYKFFVCIVLVVSFFGLDQHRANAQRDPIMTVAPSAVKSCPDGQCSLVEGIVNANADALIYPDCPSSGGPFGSGRHAFTINLAAGATYTATAVNNSDFRGNNALPQITETITIQGNGATITRAASAPEMRFVLIPTPLAFE